MSLLDQTIPVQTVKPRQVVGKASARGLQPCVQQKREMDPATRERKRAENDRRYRETKDRLLKHEAEVSRLKRLLRQIVAAREEL